MSAFPLSLSFGGVTVGNQQSLSETVTNTDGSSVIISQVAISGSGFSFSGITPPVSLTALGQSKTFTVSFAPSSAGSANGNLTITFISNPTLTIPLSGTGVAAGAIPYVAIVNSRGQGPDTARQAQPPLGAGFPLGWPTFTGYYFLGAFVPGEFANWNYFQPPPQALIVFQPQLAVPANAIIVAPNSCQVPAPDFVLAGQQWNPPTSGFWIATAAMTLPAALPRFGDSIDAMKFSTGPAFPPGCQT